MAKLRPNPCAEDPASVPPIPQLVAQSGLELGKESCTVLHVDDDPEFLELSAEFLTRLQDDFAVVTEASANAGLERLARDEIHAIVSDYDMPGMNGLEFLETVRAEHSDLPFILFTGKGSEEIAGDAIASGVTDYLQKGGGTDQYEVLANRVVNALDQYFTIQDLWTTLQSFSRLVDQDLVGVFLLQNNEFRFVNWRFARIFGMPQQALIGGSIDTVVAQADVDAMTNTIQRLETDEVESCEYHFTGLIDGGTSRDMTAELSGIDLQGESAIIGTVLPSDTLRSESG